MQLQNTQSIVENISDLAWLNNDGAPTLESTNRWTVLIVDDEQSVHEVTELVLSGKQFLSRSIEFLHAHSREQAQTILCERPDVALILLDVVMESDHAGLELVKFVRQELHNSRVRILLRTGQAGAAVQTEIVTNYDINGYLEKAVLTSPQLFCVIHTALSTYSDLIALDCAQQDLRNSLHTIKSSENRFRSLLDNSPIGLAEVALDGRFATVNPALHNMLGYTEEELTAKTFQDITHPDDLSLDLAYLQKLLDGKCETYRMDKRYFKKSGQILNVQLDVALLRSSNGTPLHFISQIQDITARINSEEVLAQANNLREAIMNAAPYSIIATDPQGLITSINPAAERMLWYTREDLVGKQTPQIIHDKDEVISRAQELSIKYRRTIEPGFEVFVHESRAGLVDEHEWTYIRKDGSRFQVQLAVTALTDANQTIIGFLGIAHDITQRKRREEYVRHVSLHDELTGLPNRTLLNDRLNVAIEGARRNHKKVGVMMLDLDHFKRINDTWGHHIGDEVLKIVAERISTNLRRSDTAARMGGDEFIVVTPDMSETKNSDLIASTLVNAISAPIIIGSHEFTITPSIGVSCYPDDGEEIHTLVKHADAAMYQAKAAGRFRHLHFSADANAAAQRRLEMESELRFAIANNRLQVHYQPQICLKTGRVIGAEALARWIDPIKGAIPPELFISVAEESGLIIALGDYVLRTACRDATILQKRAGHPLIMAVNLSARQFKQGNLIETVKSVLDKSGMDPSLLELEITEGVMMENDENTRLRMQGLRNLGISLAVDDFGTGYSSLSYLTQFPISTLKIDRSFVSRMVNSERDAAVVQAIIAMACSLKTKVVAEGVETPEQLEFLQRHVCNAAQGFLLGHSLDVDQFNAQGYQFCKPVSVTELVETFDLVQVGSSIAIAASLH